MSELTGPVLGITLVLTAVFLPASFLPGITGQMFRQFALVIAATAIISAINALTLKPTQCALYLRPAVKDRQVNWFYRGFNRAYGAVEGRYIGLVQWMVGRPGKMACAFSSALAWLRLPSRSIRRRFYRWKTRGSVFWWRGFLPASRSRGCARFRQMSMLFSGTFQASRVG